MWTVRRLTSGGISVATCACWPLFPVAVAGGLALAEPAERRLRAGIPIMPGRRLVLAVAPGAARALLVVPIPARDANHVSILRLGPRLLGLDTAGTYRT
jgi:hypothetical protein